MDVRFAHMLGKEWACSVALISVFASSCLVGIVGHGMYWVPGGVEGRCLAGVTM